MGNTGSLEVYILNIAGSQNATLINGGTSACYFLSGALCRMSHNSSRWRCVISRNGVVIYPADTNPAAPPYSWHVEKCSFSYETLV